MEPKHSADYGLNIAAGVTVLVLWLAAVVILINALGGVLAAAFQ